MIEKIILDYLNEKLEEPVYMEVPEKPPERYVVLEKTGSSNTNYIEAATIAIQSIAETMFAAAHLNEMVKKHMEKIVELDSICKAKLNSDYNYTDTTKKEYRYQAVFDLVHY